MKLIIQIPCFNEEQTLPLVLRDLPKKIKGIDDIETLVINDGSTDKTAEVAMKSGVNHVVDISSRRGLANAFRSGLDKALELGADVIVNTDGDNQYKGEDIGKLVEPILEKKADIVVGSRDISTISHFSWIKKMLQFAGSFVVRKFSKTRVPDTTSGFRAFSREAALKLNVFSGYTYTLETIIQAGRKNIPITSVGIKTNGKLRESRLIKNPLHYVLTSAVSILRIYLVYEPLKSFFAIGGLIALPGVFLVARFLHAHFTKVQGGHIQSLIIAAILLIVSFSAVMLGLIGDVLAGNRKLSEEVLYRLRKQGRLSEEEKK
ncbi:MAG: glycosyltransferase family 2 protein [Candidatus Omnitrophota bacterium]|jgi:glycosyltransferase involved in cell wall biosynthesis